MRAWAAAPSLVVLCLLAPACSSGASRGPSTATAPSTDRGSAATSTAVAAETVATYRRSPRPGGQAFEVVVRSDGTFEGGTGKRGRLGSAGLDELRSLVAAFSAASPDAAYGAPGAASSATRIDAGGATTTVFSGATPPDPVLRLVSFLAALERQLPR